MVAIAGLNLVILVSVLKKKMVISYLALMTFSFLIAFAYGNGPSCILARTGFAFCFFSMPLIAFVYLLRVGRIHSKSERRSDRFFEGTVIACVLPCAVGLLITTLTGGSLVADSIDFEPLPVIKADAAHQIDLVQKNSVTYEVPSGKGFVLDTSEYKKQYADADSNFFSGIKYGVRLDPALASAELVADQNLYRLCPYARLRRGDKFTVTMYREITDWGNAEYSPFWTARVIVK